MTLLILATWGGDAALVGEPVAGVVVRQVRCRRQPIGRRVSDCDLAIRDGNISRRHAAIVRHHGTYYIKDLGSTNGVQFQGARVNSRRLDEGDLFVICDYELRFTYVE